MTRVNIVDPSLLTDQHLMAEARELPHVFSYVERHYHPSKIKNVAPTYTLNAGHVTFFINKLEYVYSRMFLLVEELHKRGVDKQFDINTWNSRYAAFSTVLKQNYTPSIAEVEVNVERIVARIMEKPTWYRYNREPLFVTEDLAVKLKSAYLGKNKSLWSALYE
jgi:deoxyribonuclease (pyrimidine dimer)